MFFLNAVLLGAKDERLNIQERLIAERKWRGIKCGDCVKRNKEKETKREEGIETLKHKANGNKERESDRLLRKNSL